MTRKEEVGSKVQKVRQLIAAVGLKGVLLKSQPSFCWITAGGLNVMTIADTAGVASILITPRDAFFVTDTIEIARMTEEEQLETLGFTPIVFEWYKGSEAAAISRIAPAADVACDLPLAGFRFMEKEIRELRYALLAPEIERYLWLGERASSGIESVLRDVAKPGRKESEIVGELSKVLWAQRIDSVCWQAAADERAFRYRHAIPTERAIQKYLMLNVNARKWGLVTTVTRSVHFGTADPKLIKQYRDTTYIECAMIAFTRPKSAVADIFSKTCDLYQQVGYPGEWKNHHQGGAQGYRNRDYLMKPDSTEKVLENQCFCWNPSISGTKSEDAFIVRGDGPQFITKPMGFPTLTIDYEGIHFVRPALLEK
jgi:Xaa-Pro aminopeptidase